MAVEEPGASGDGLRMSAAAASLTWAGLVALTLTGWAFARLGVGAAAVAALCALAGVKVYLILGQFMGTWRAPAWCHRLALAWAAAVFAAICAVTLRGLA